MVSTVDHGCSGEHALPNSGTRRAVWQSRKTRGGGSGAHTRARVAHTPAASVAALPAPGPRWLYVGGGLLSIADLASDRCFAWMASSLAWREARE